MAYLSKKTDAFNDMSSLIQKYYETVSPGTDERDLPHQLIDLAAREFYFDPESDRTVDDYVEEIQLLLAGVGVGSDQIKNGILKRCKVISLAKKLYSNRLDGELVLYLLWDEGEDGEERYDDEEYHPNKCLLRLPVDEIAAKPEKIIDMIESLANEGLRMWWKVGKVAEEDKTVFIDSLIKDKGNYIVEVLRGEEMYNSDDEKLSIKDADEPPVSPKHILETREKVPEKVEVIYTHFNVDLDAVASVWALKKFVQGARNAEIRFVPANFAGERVKGDEVALDLDAGSKGIKGEQVRDERIHSCFRSIIAAFASEEDQAALQKLVAYIDAQDTYGSAIKHLAPEISKAGSSILHASGVNAVLRALQAMNPRNDPIVVKKMSEIFDGLLKAGRARQRGNKEVQEKAEILPSGKVAIVKNSTEYSTNGILFDEYGVRVIVYIDGNNLGIIRHGDEKLRMDHPDLQAIVESYGEKDEWFAHPAGFLYCRGSRKAPASNSSTVDPYELAKKINELIEN